MIVSNELTKCMMAFGFSGCLDLKSVKIISHPHPRSTTVFRNIYQECHPQNKIKLYVFCPIMLRWCNVMNFLMKILSGPTIFYLADFCWFFFCFTFCENYFFTLIEPTICFEMMMQRQILSVLVTPCMSLVVY